MSFPLQSLKGKKKKFQGSLHVCIVAIWQLWDKRSLTQDPESLTKQYQNKTHEKKVSNTHIKIKGHLCNCEDSAVVREIKSVDDSFLGGQQLVFTTRQ